MMRVVAAELIGYAAMWVTFPLLLVSVARLIDRGPKIWGAISVYNWLSVLAIALQLPIAIAVYSGISVDWGDRLGLLA